MAKAKKNLYLYDAQNDLNKKWFVAYYDEYGKRQRVYGDINKHTTQQDRREAAALLMLEIQSNLLPPPQLPNHEQREQLYSALEAYSKKVRRTTYVAYRWKLNDLFEYLDGRPITKKSLQEYFENATNKHSVTTVHNTRMMMKRVLGLAKLDHLLEDIHVRKGQKQPLRYFQPHQVKQIVEYLEVRDPRLLLWAKFVYYCFLRPRSELRFLRVSDIYFEEKKILVRGEFFKHEPGSPLPPGAKNGKSQYVRIPDAFMPDLEHLKSLPPDSWVFANTKGKVFGKNQLGEKFRAVLDHLGYGPEYQVYSFKHTGAVACVKAGIGLKELQLQLRHHSLDQVNEYLRQLGVMDFENIGKNFPKMGA
jgi:integrase